MNTAWLIPAKNKKKRITITTTEITKITKKKVTEKDHIDHDVFEDERGNFTSMRRFFHDSKFFVETRDRPIIN